MATATATDDEILRLVAHKSKAANKAAAQYSSRLTSMLDQLQDLTENLSTKANRETLQSLLLTLQKFVQVKTSVPVAFPLGSIFLLFANLCSVEGKISELPAIHACMFRILESVCVRFGNAAKSVHKTVLEYVAWIFARERHSAALREAAYALLACVLEFSGAALSKETVQLVAPALEACCLDIIPETPKDDKKSEDVKTTLVRAVTDQAKHQDSDDDDDELMENRKVYEAAQTLLTVALGNLPFEYLSRSARARLERTAILTNDCDAMLAATLNTSPNVPLQKSHSSLLPFLARAYSTVPAVESLLRPRMPQVNLTSNGLDDAESQSDESSIDNTAIQEDVEPRPSELPLDNQTSIPDQHSEVVETALDSAPEVSFAVPRPPIVDEASMFVAEQAAQQPLSQPAFQETFSTSRKRITSDAASVAAAAETGSKRPRIDDDVSHSDERADHPQPTSQVASIAEPEFLPETAKTVDNNNTDDDDDFDLPPLTMEQDTEDEDEDDGGG